MALDPRYVTSVSLEEFFVNKDLGIPNSFGTIEFWQDDNRVVPKNVYQLTGAPPNYTYTALPNPITLSAVGTPSDPTGNNVAIYYFPYDADGNVQLYYVVVRDQNGTVQETREAWPNTTPSDNPVEQESGLFNQLVNPQFAFINFLPNNPLTITNSAGAGVYNYDDVIPGWTITVDYTGNGSIQVQRTAIAGTSFYPGNPPYTISITPGANVQEISLNQVLSNNPNIFAPAPGGANGYIAASILLAPLSSVEMFYTPNGQAPQQILAANNTTGSFAEYDSTVQLAVANNANTADTGFVTISIDLPIAGTTTFSNVQIVGLSSNVQGVKFNQETVVQQSNQTFNYYNPLLQFKPIPSYLIGWEFSKNPAQFLSSTVGAFATGANTSNYVWDQTIVFQSANSGFTTSRSTTGGLALTAAAGTRLGVIQYLESPICNSLLLENLCSMVESFTDQVGGFPVTISLWSTTNPALPNIAANASLVTALDANGFPTVAAGWTEVARGNLGNAKFTSAGNAGSYNYNGFKGWGASIATAQAATFFAIVIGTGDITAGRSWYIQSISLLPGDIPTIPAPKTSAEVLVDCQYYYSKSFAIGTVPTTVAGVNTGEQIFTPGIAGVFTNLSPTVPYPTRMRITPNTIIYNTTNNNNQVNDANIGAGGDSTNSMVVNNSERGFFVSETGNAGTVIGNRLGFHWTADARLGF